MNQNYSGIPRQSKSDIRNALYSQWGEKEIGSEGLFTHAEFWKIHLGLDLRRKEIDFREGYSIEFKDIIAWGCNLTGIRPDSGKKQLPLKQFVDDIKTYYVSEYFLQTSKEVAGKKLHPIGELLFKIGLINKAKGKYEGQYLISSYYLSIQSFHSGIFPKDLFYPVKQLCGYLFNGDQYRVRDFWVKDELKILPK